MYKPTYNNTFMLATQMHIGLTLLTVITLWLRALQLRAKAHSCPYGY
jgi:hypothetical protein